MIKEKRTKYIVTDSGVKFYPLSPRFNDININDIAHGLSQLCRFSGQTTSFLSVAQHSLMVSEIAEDLCPGAALAGLLHDASEAYMVDIPSPIKTAPFMSGYRRAEDHLIKLIFKKFDVPVNDGIMEAVKEADFISLNLEIDRWTSGDALIKLPEKTKTKYYFTSFDMFEVENQFLARFKWLKSLNK